jgi:hypothetical protein
MNIFVQDNEVVEIKLHYAIVGKKVKILDAPTEGATTLTVVFRQPDFATSQRLISTSTTIGNDGNPVLNIMLLQTNLIYFLAQSWDAKDGEGKPIALNGENIGKLRIEVARALTNKLAEEVGQII